jgi:hypothetical protein
MQRQKVRKGGVLCTLSTVTVRLSGTGGSVRRSLIKTEG